MPPPLSLRRSKPCGQGVCTHITAVLVCWELWMQYTRPKCAGLGGGCRRIQQLHHPSACHRAAGRGPCAPTPFNCARGRARTRAMPDVRARPQVVQRGGADLEGLAWARRRLRHPHVVELKGVRRAGDTSCWGCGCWGGVVQCSLISCPACRQCHVRM